jgi:O-antigen ligase
VRTAYSIDAPGTGYVPAAMQVRVAKLHPRVLLEVAICVMPTMTLVGFGKLYAGSRWLFIWLTLFMLYHFLARKPIQAIALIVALVPTIMLVRGAFYYSAPIVISVAAVFMQVALSPEELVSLKRNKMLVALLSFAVIYWWLSFIKSGDYSSNIRILELSFIATSVYLMGNHRSYLATAIVGLAFSVICEGAGLLPFGDRLGGNPIAIGLSATFIFLFAIVDRGQWLFVEKHRISRSLLAVLAAACLVLSTSRGSWLVALVGLLVILIFNKESRGLLLTTVLLVTVLIAILLQSSRGPVVKHYFDNATDSDKSLAKRTTGRADQWQSFPRVLGDSPLWGFGPGSGKAVSLRYTKEGKPWHALYLLIGTETGLIGLICLAGFLGTLLRRGLVHWRSCGELGPLLALICFMIIGVSVSGIDAISGVFLGFAFVGSDLLMIRVRHVVMPEGLLHAMIDPDAAAFTELL